MTSLNSSKLKDKSIYSHIKQTILTTLYQLSKLLASFWQLTTPKNWHHFSNRHVYNKLMVAILFLQCVLVRWWMGWTPVPAELSQWFCRTDYQLSRHRKPRPDLSFSWSTDSVWTHISFLATSVMKQLGLRTRQRSTLPNPHKKKEEEKHTLL